MKIPRHTIDQINEQADLVSIIGRHTTLKPAGKEFRGCCPFHGEKTPSFFVNPHTNLYYCFGCGAKGNAISFLVDYERLSFVEAVKELAQSAGVDLPAEDKDVSYKRKSTKKPSDNTPKPPTNHLAATTNQDENPPMANKNAINPPAIVDNTNTSKTNTEDYDRFLSDNNADNSDEAAYFHPPIQDNAQDDADGDLYSLLNAVSGYYRRMLQQTNTALRYFGDRNVSPQMVDYFELGYAPSDWQHLEKAFPNDIEGLKILGLIRQSDKGRHYNLMRDRVIFPIKDAQGQIVGFAGRAMNDKDMPKYINSTDSIVFQKNHILYGYYEARQKRAKDWLIVEGYMDVIALYQAGIYGAVAPMGTAINENQIARLLKFNNTLTLCFDGDKAGQKAAMRTLQVAMPVLHDGKTLKFLTLEDNHDPDTYVNTFGKEAMINAIANASSTANYLFGYYHSNFDLSLPEQKAAAMANLKELTKTLPKGSSFRSWLNGDMYQRFWAMGKKTPPKTTVSHNTLKISAIDQILLSILYEPALLGNNSLKKIYEHSQIKDIDQSFINKIKDLPALPTWQDLHTDFDEFDRIITTVCQALNTANTPASTSYLIDARARMILGAMDNPTLKEPLLTQWADFFYYTQSRHIEELTPFFEELLCQVVIDILTQEQQQATGLALTSLYKKRLIALQDFDKNVLKPAIA